MTMIVRADIKCDGEHCGRLLGPGLFPSPATALHKMHSDGWAIAGREHFCPNCIAEAPQDDADAKTKDGE